MASDGVGEDPGLPKGTGAESSRSVPARLLTCCRNTTRQQTPPAQHISRPEDALLTFSSAAPAPSHFGAGVSIGKERDQSKQCVRAHRKCSLAARLDCARVQLRPPGLAQRWRRAWPPRPANIQHSQLRLAPKACRGLQVAIGETVILLHPPLPLVGVSIVMEGGRQQNDRTLVKWLGCVARYLLRSAR